MFYAYHPIKNQRDMQTEEYILDTQNSHIHYMYSTCSEFQFLSTNFGLL